MSERGDTFDHAAGLMAQAPTQGKSGELVFRYSKPELVLVGVGGASLASFLGAAYSSAPLKALALLFLLMATFGTVSLLFRHADALSSVRTLFMLGILSILPVFRIFFEVIPTLDRQNIVYGIVLITPYYLLPFASLGLLAALSKVGENLARSLRRSMVFLVVMTIVLAFSGFYTLDHHSVGGIYTIYNNLLIPFALLLFLKSRSIRFALMGAVALGSIILFSALQGSRSYLLVAGYLGLLAVLLVGRRPYLKFLAILLFCGLILFALPFISSLSAGVRDTFVVIEKLRLDSMGQLLASFFQNGDFLALYFWEGNSRAQILLDAFVNFTWWDYFWGRGVTAVYQSFVVRTTIEIGYAQELFWLGLVTCVPAILYTLFSLSMIIMRRNWRRSFIGMVFLAVAVTRLLDGVIFGMPQSSLYMLFYWMSLMWLALKPRYREAIFSGNPVRPFRTKDIPVV